MSTLLERLLPARADNAYRGHPLALWLFGAVVLLKAGIGFGTLFNGRNGAVKADGIALESFGAQGADAFISLFAAWGLAQVTLAAVSLTVLVRFRTLVPAMLVLLLAEHLLRKLVFVVLPIARTGVAPGLFINLAIVAAMVIALVLSLRERPLAETNA